MAMTGTIQRFEKYGASSCASVCIVRVMMGLPTVGFVRAGGLQPSFSQEDPACLAARKLDWEEFMSTQTDRVKAIIANLAEGNSLKSVAKKFKLSTSTIRYHKERLTKSIKEFMGEDVLAMIVKPPEWKNDLVAREKHAH